MDEKGKLYIVATPIGNLGDMTIRAIETLKSVDIILCEDTRVSKKLLDHYGIITSTISYRDQNHLKVVDQIRSHILSGKNLALISDAGTPLISDPGYKLVADLLQNGITVESIPGASSVISALVLSGLPSDRFIFLGFLPKSHSKQKEILSTHMKLESSIIIYESPFRIIKLLEVLAEIDKNRKIALVNDQTKMYERVWRGEVESVLSEIKTVERLKGEFTLVISKQI